uniref:Signal transducer and transcription activator n=2 Tax=Culicoides sonorensis TaxID=179676 RepID=A0A336KNR7_CULSO
MALWSRILNMPGEAMQSVRQHYGNSFPIEVRHYLAEWIEDRLLNTPHIDSQDPQFEQEAATFFHGLITELERKSEEIVDENQITCRLRLCESARQFRTLFSHNPGQLYSHIRQGIDFERQLICYPESIGYVQDQEIQEITHALHELQKLVRANDYENKNLQKDYEIFYLEVHEFSKKQAALNNEQMNLTPEMRERNLMMMEERQQKLDAALNQLTGKRLSLVDSFKNVNAMITQIQTKVIGKYLSQWKINQGKAGNGAMPLSPNTLDMIQSWCENLAEIIWSTREQIRQVSKYKKQLGAEEPNLLDFLPQLQQESTNLLTNLITATFVIEKQPPQVMKTNTRFPSAVRLLVGNTLNIKMSSPQVKVSIVSEAQAQHVTSTNKVTEPMACGEIINNVGTMEYNETSKALSVNFRNMQLKKIKRAEKKGTESVMDEKFALLFTSNFAVGHGDIVFTVWALSLPVVVIVHGNQEPQSWATITWDNAFAEINRIPFQVPDKVPWYLLAEALNMKFKNITGKALTVENMHFLCEKAFKTSIPSPIPNDLYISWAQFCKEPLPDRTFTFWDWFYAAMKVTREHLRGPWSDNSVIGFIHKRTSEELLLKCTRGTFLLRFSDSELGGITIAWVNEGEDMPPQVLHIQPFTAKDFTTRSLSDRIRDLDELLYLYPNKPKNDVFSKYSPPSAPPKNTDYIVSGIRAVLPVHPGNMSYPGTPASQYNLQSPDPSRDTNSVASAYGIEQEKVRACMADWIENQFKQEQNNPELFFELFIEELNKVYSDQPQICLKNRLFETLLYLTKYENYFRYTLMQDLYKYLSWECQLSNDLEEGKINKEQQNMNFINEKIAEIQQKDNVINRSLIQQLNDIIERYKMFVAENNQIEINQLNRSASECCSRIIGHFEDILKTIDQIEKIICEVFLNPWMINPKRQIESAWLDIIQNWNEIICFILVCGISNMKSIAENFSFINGLLANISNLEERAKIILKEIISYALVCEEPKRIIKTETKFELKVRLLINANYLPLNNKVTIQLISGESAYEILQSGIIPETLNTGELLNSAKSFEINPPAICYSTRFKNLKITKRPKQFDGARGNFIEGVVERRTALLFQTFINYYGHEFHLFRVSKPIILVCHNNQEPIANAALVWDDAFAAPENPFAKIESGSWDQLGKAISNRFKSELNRGLSEENLNFLLTKVSSSNGTVVTWLQFAKEKLRPVPTMAEKDCFTFWEWLYASLKLILNNFVGMWQNNYIEGFISKSAVAEKLKGCENGTFLLRFSDSMKGAISISYIENKIVNHIAPNDQQELNKRDIIDRIRALDDLKFLYPRIPKEEICKNFVNKEIKKTAVVGDYIQPVVSETLPSTSQTLASTSQTLSSTGSLKMEISSDLDDEILESIITEFIENENN